MADTLSIGDLGPEKSAHIYRIVFAAILTVLIVPTQPVHSVEISAAAVGIGALLAALHVAIGNGFDSPVRTTVERRDYLIVAGTIAVGLVLVVVLPMELFPPIIHGAVAYAWAGSIAAAVRDWQQDPEQSSSAE